MGSALPSLDREAFQGRLEKVVDSTIDPALADRLFAHFEELRRWNPGVSLVGPGTGEEVVERHYGEGLLGASLLRESDRRLVDLGSGGGFPGFVLAAAAPGLDVWLVEPRRKKWAFLRGATAAAALSCRCLDARVGAALPADFPDRIDVLTVRALRLDETAWGALAHRLAEDGRLLRWGGSEPPEELAAWNVGTRLRLPGRDRWVLELLPPRPPE